MMNSNILSDIIRSSGITQWWHHNEQWQVAIHIYKSQKHKILLLLKYDIMKKHGVRVEDVETMMKLVAIAVSNLKNKSKYQ